MLLFLWTDQHEKSWSKQNQDRWKVIQKYSYLLHWIRDGEKPKICKNWCANPLHLIISKINGYTEESNGNKSLMLVPTHENKEITKNLFKNSGVISEILLDQTLITPMIMMKNIWKSNLISMIISH